MAREICISRQDGICVFSSEGKCLRRAALEGAGALCIGGERLFCAVNEGRMIARLELRTLRQEAMFAGGPGIVQLLLSADETRLYALCADADSVLMLDAWSGAPMIVCRVGCNPQQMAMDGDTLAVSGGESGCVHLLDAHTLEARGRLSMPGPVYSAALRGEDIHALCLTQTLDTLLVTDAPEGRAQHELAGMPGRILLLQEGLLVSTHGRLYTACAEGKQILREGGAPGRASALLALGSRVMLCDILSGRLFCRDGEGVWRVLCAGARDVQAV